VPGSVVARGSRGRRGRRCNCRRHRGRRRGRRLQRRRRVRASISLAPMPQQRGRCRVSPRRSRLLPCGLAARLAHRPRVERQHQRQTHTAPSPAVPRAARHRRCRAHGVRPCPARPWVHFLGFPDVVPTHDPKKRDYHTTVHFVAGIIHGTQSSWRETSWAALQSSEVQQPGGGSRKTGHKDRGGDTGRGGATLLWAPRVRVW